MSSSRKKTVKKKRDLDKYPALNPRLNAKTRYELLDMDYLKQLDDEQLKFLNQMMAEWVSGAFKKNPDGTFSDENTYKTQEERRERWRNNNIRNRCGLTIAKATGNVVHVDDITSFLDGLQDTDLMAQHTNQLSDTILNDYDGDYEELEKDIAKDMYQDYKRCLIALNTPEKSLKADRDLLNSNYGKRLLELFKDVQLEEESDDS